MLLALDEEGDKAAIRTQADGASSQGLRCVRFDRFDRLIDELSRQIGQSQNPYRLGILFKSKGSS
jgi:hypothetical protein